MDKYLFACGFLLAIVEILPLVGNLWLDYVNQGGLREELGR